MDEPLESFHATFTLTQLVRSRHIQEVFEHAEHMTENEAAVEASREDVVLVLGIHESQADGLLILNRGAELPRLIYYRRNSA